MDPTPNGDGAPPEPSIGRLHVITDYHLQQRMSHAELARLAIRGGADSIQFRQKHGNIRNVLLAAHDAKQACTESSLPLIVDDRVDVAQAVEAQGVHLGQRDFPIAEARRLLAPGVVIGATCTTASQAARAEAEGANYIGFGPVFETRSKRNPKTVKGLGGLQQACDAVSVPVIAIGGITHDRVRAILDAGAHGIAVLSAVATATHPERATARFRAAIDGALRDD